MTIEDLHENFNNKNNFHILEIEKQKASLYNLLTTGDLKYSPLCFYENNDNRKENIINNVDCIIKDKNSFKKFLETLEHRKNISFGFGTGASLVLGYLPILKEISNKGIHINHRSGASAGSRVATLGALDEINEENITHLSINLDDILKNEDLPKERRIPLFTFCKFLPFLVTFKGKEGEKIDIKSDLISHYKDLFDALSCYQIEKIFTKNGINKKIVIDVLKKTIDNSITDIDLTTFKGIQDETGKSLALFGSKIKNKIFFESIKFDGNFPVIEAIIHTSNAAGRIKSSIRDGMTIFDKTGNKINMKEKDITITDGYFSGSGTMSKAEHYTQEGSYNVSFQTLNNYKLNKYFAGKIYGRKKPKKGYAPIDAVFSADFGDINSFQLDYIKDIHNIGHTMITNKHSRKNDFYQAIVEKDFIKITNKDNIDISFIKEKKFNGAKSKLSLPKSSNNSLSTVLSVDDIGKLSHIGDTIVIDETRIELLHADAHHRYGGGRRRKENKDNLGRYIMITTRKGKKHIAHISDNIFQNIYHESDT